MASPARGTLDNPFDTPAISKHCQLHNSMTGNSRFAVSVHILAYLAFRQGAAVPSAEIAGSVRHQPGRDPLASFPRS